MSGSCGIDSADAEAPSRCSQGVDDRPSRAALSEPSARVVGRTPRESGAGSMPSAKTRVSRKLLDDGEARSPHLHSIVRQRNATQPSCQAGASSEAGSQRFGRCWLLVLGPPRRSSRCRSCAPSRSNRERRALRRRWDPSLAWRYSSNSSIGVQMIGGSKPAARQTSSILPRIVACAMCLQFQVSR